MMKNNNFQKDVDNLFTDFQDTINTIYKDKENGTLFTQYEFTIENLSDEVAETLLDNYLFAIDQDFIIFEVSNGECNIYVDFDESDNYEEDHYREDR